MWHPADVDIGPMKTRTGPQDADSLQAIYDEMLIGMNDLAEAIRYLRTLPKGPASTIPVLGSRGMVGTERYPGVIPKFGQFSSDAKKKASLQVREYQRKRRG
jgi:hypothetical protein